MIIHGLSPLLQVFDMAESVAFYRDVIGFAIIAMSGRDDADQVYTTDPDGYEMCFQRAVSNWAEGTGS
jgi:catechol 2,3-dioxygenase-like lactoylglutathione lyase family enzyme